MVKMEEIYMVQTWIPSVMLLIKGKCVFWTAVQWYVFIDILFNLPCFNYAIDIDNFIIAQLTLQ